MVRLYEYQGKQLLQKIGLSTPAGSVADTVEEAGKIAEKLGRPVVVKAQILATGRGKAGGVKFAFDAGEARAAAGALLGAEVKGFKVERVLVEERLDIEEEYYVGVIVDSSYRVRGPVVIFSTEGGLDLEEVADKSPEKIGRKRVNIFHGLRIHDVYNLLRELKVDSSLLRPLGGALVGVYNLFRMYDARVLEVNPLVMTRDGTVVATDCRVTIDDSSVSRHPELGFDVARDSDRPPTKLDKVAWTIEEGDYRGASFFAKLVTEVGLEGYVGYHGIGGGGAILGVDALTRQGLKIANYADTSGNPTASKVYRVVKTILSQRNIEGYILAGFCVANQEQWHHAHGIVKALREDLRDMPGFPVVLVVAGNKEEESIQILREGLEDLPIRLEIFGREHVYDTDFVARRMRELVEEYREERGT